MHCARSACFRTRLLLFEHRPGCLNIGACVRTIVSACSNKVCFWVLLGASTNFQVVRTRRRLCSNNCWFVRTHRVCVRTQSPVFEHPLWVIEHRLVCSNKRPGVRTPSAGLSGRRFLAHPSGDRRLRRRRSSWLLRRRRGVPTGPAVAQGALAALDAVPGGSANSQEAFVAPSRVWVPNQYMMQAWDHGLKGGCGISLDKFLPDRRLRPLSKDQKRFFIPVAECPNAIPFRARRPCRAQGMCAGPLGVRLMVGIAEGGSARVRALASPHRSCLHRPRVDRVAWLGVLFQRVGPSRHSLDGPLAPGM